VVSKFYSEKDEESYYKDLESIGINRDKIVNKKYWEFVQGHPNPYGKEFYDYVQKHDFIKFSSNPEIARKEMREINYKMHANPMYDDIPTLPCEKSTFRLLLELALSLLDNSI